MKRVIVIGAGMTGLACAWALRGKCEVVVLESSDRVGGNIRTIRESDFVMDAGPDAWLATKPEASALAREAGLTDTMGTRPEYRRVYVAHEGRLHAMPEGVVLGVPTRIAPMVTTRLFSVMGKARMGIEPLVPRGHAEDESVADFIGRRLGREAVDRLAGPLLGGIFAGDVERISIKAAFPQLVEQEAKYGSLIRAMRALRKERASKSNGASSPEGESAFVSLRSGMSAFPEKLAASLDVRLAKGARKVSRTSAGYEIDVGAETLACDAVVFAASAPTVATLLAPLDAEASEKLAAIRCGSSAAVFLGYRRADVEHPLDATGFVVPRSADGELTAVTFVSSKWENRAPEGHVLLRAFVGGAGREAVLDCSDANLVETCRAEIGKLLGRVGEPVLTRVFRHVLASPQPDVGHIARMRSLTERLERLPGIYLAGNGYNGTGIPDCIRQARTVAAAILA